MKVTKNENNLISSSILLEKESIAQQEMALRSTPSVSKKAAFRKFAAENRPLLIAIEENQEERKWDEILKDFQDLSKPLTLSNKEMDRILAFYGISDINARDPDPVEQRIMKEEKAMELVQRGYLPIEKIVREGLNPLDKAIFANDAPLVRLLLSKGASPLMKRKFSGSKLVHQIVGYTTAISHAIEFQNIAVIQQFVDAGFDPNCVVNSQSDFFWGVPGGSFQTTTALEFAKQFGNDSIVALILGSKEIDPNI